MHGLVNRALQRFAEDTFGLAVWSAAADAAQPGLSGFESMLTYRDGLTEAVVDALSEQTGTPRRMLLEDLGTYLVSHAHTHALRRLMRFGGVNFAEFLESLEELPDRVRLAVPELALPAMELVEHTRGRFLIKVGPGLPGFGDVLVGLLRAMADDYGSLAFVDLQHDGPEAARIEVMVAEQDFAEGRSFDLAPAEAAR